MTLLLRAAELNDAPGIHGISQYLGYGEQSLADAQQALEELLDSPNDMVFVALKDGELVGWIHAFWAQRLASASFYEIGGLVVAPNVRRQGIANALVQEVLTQVDGTVRVRCNELRTDAHQFYQALGFITNKSQRIFEKSC